MPDTVSRFKLTDWPFAQLSAAGQLNYMDESNAHMCVHDLLRICVVKHVCRQYADL